MSRSFRGRPDPQDNRDQGPDDANATGAQRPQPRGNMPQRSSMRPNVRSGPQSQPPAQRKADYLPEYAEEEQGYSNDSEVSQPSEMNKRFVAALIDVVVGYILNLMVNCIPFVNVFLHDQIVMVSYLLVKDFLFGGRGVGKNLMGLQVVDARTGAPASLLQSIQRNIVIFGPYILMYISNLIIKFIPDENIKSIAQSVVLGIGAVYIIIALPYEAYRLYSRADGNRWGDQIAGTTTVPADMDFGNPAGRRN